MRPIALEGSQSDRALRAALLFRPYGATRMDDVRVEERRPGARGIR